MSDRGRRPPTFADACEAVLSNPGDDHGAETTLAPVHARSIPDGWGERRKRLVASRFSADVDRVLELGCGVGALLRELGTEYDVVGVDSRREYVRFPAARGAAVVRGDPTRPPVRPVFDGVCAVEDVASNVPPVDLSVAAYGALRPGGIFVVAAPTDPTAVLDSGVETYSGSRYLLERAVDVAADGVATIDYRISDRRTGKTAVTTEKRAVHTTSADGLTAALRTAGFENVLVAGESDVPGIVVGAGVRPVDTGGPADVGTSGPPVLDE
ncbi:bifunctional 2-polyprenyl-6-hydroxyphenol methylase/3-demethylubiquinol 3-O-methyltransferase UbiG [Halobellus sp. Atlit-38R]|uniref:class I SAM-dependent methyltransferase n=1 Tax=Halobellus sp. Atlit-38R TaxID=2282131 RepID=UPI001F3AE576|nr:class I SAM-dependent methyltransferase [Halobellus sp. Atlit-38R]